MVFLCVKEGAYIHAPFVVGFISPLFHVAIEPFQHFFRVLAEIVVGEEALGLAFDPEQFFVVALELGEDFRQ